MFQTKFVDKIEAHIVCAITFFFSLENRADYKLQNVVKWGGPQI